MINKNLIEVIALLGIAAMPTGSWFGVDALLARLCGGCCKRKSETVELAETLAVAATPETTTENAAATGDSSSESDS